MTIKLCTAVTFACLLAACDFANYEPLVESSEVPYGSSNLALSADASVVWHGGSVGGSDPVEAFDAATGAPLASLPVWPHQHGVRDLAAAWEAGAPRGVWVLHLSGWRTRWAANGGFVEQLPPIPSAQFPGTRTYCKFTTGPDGAQFITTMELPGGVFTIFLYRRDADGTWTRVETSPSGCDVTYDHPVGFVAVHDWPSESSPTNVLRYYDATTLDLALEVDLPGLTGQANDFASFALQTIWATGGDLYLVDHDGNLADVGGIYHSQGVTVDPNQVQPRVLWSGADTPASGTDYALGWFDLVPE